MTTSSIVDAEHALDLREETFEQADVAAGDALDGGDGSFVGEVIGDVITVFLSPSVRLQGSV